MKVWVYRMYVFECYSLSWSWSSALNVGAVQPFREQHARRGSPPVQQGRDADGPVPGFLKLVIHLDGSPILERCSFQL